MPYYSTDAAQINDGSANHDGYQQFQPEATLQVQPKQDEYYTVSPGENYYTDYENVNENQTYTVPSNARNSRTSETSATDQQKLQQQQPQPQQQHHQQQEKQQPPQPPLPAAHVPNYLQSDTDDSQIGYQNQPTNNAPQSQDSNSDFDFSTNS